MGATAKKGSPAFALGVLVWPLSLCALVLASSFGTPFLFVRDRLGAQARTTTAQEIEKENVHMNCAPTVVSRPVPHAPCSSFPKKEKQKARSPNLIRALGRLGPVRVERTQKWEKT